MNWPNGTLGLILILLLIACCVVFLWANINIEVK